jgi:hypothetical protein
MTDNSTSSVDWQPIETAPHDGTWILLCGGKCTGEGPDPWQAACVTACWDAENYYARREMRAGSWVRSYWDAWHLCLYDAPTHWAPLPKGPADV